MTHASTSLTSDHNRNGHLLTRIHVAVLATQAAAGLAIVALAVQVGSFGPAVQALALLQVLSVAGGLYLRGRALHMRKRQARAVQEQADARERTEQLFAMTDMLQAAETYDDAGSVLMASCRRLLPQYGASLYVFNNSRDRLDLACSWDLPAELVPPETLSPANCWALKRGKTHINAPDTNGLCCAHHGSHIATIEIPMMACGQVHGLLVLTRDAAGDGDATTSTERVSEISRLGRAIADSMSLALSNIALREKLRTQSLRDPLTGLYNRRYMEDALQRFLALGSRNGSSTTVIMLDLDNFKKLNDQHGHAKGDAVLRDVAAQIVGTIRPSDVACRYGGEELLVILPDCPVDDAVAKAESLRQRIAALSEAHSCAVSASLGVAVVPDTTASPGDLVAHADAALYAAKKAGKNRVETADRSAAKTPPRLAVNG